MDTATKAPLPGTVVFIDGECLLCSHTAAWLAARDPERRLRFAHLQGPLAAQWLTPEMRDLGPGGAVVLLEPGHDNRLSVRSAAILRCLGHLGGAWSLLAPLASVPGVPRLLNFGYGYVARNRDRWFGRDAKCLVPTPDLRDRFILQGDQT